MVVLSFCCCLLLFTGIGIASIRFRQTSSADYLIADRSVPPWLVGLSAVATTNSGFMFTGMIGYTYWTGLSAIWVLFPWVAGDFLASFFIHKRLRIETERQQAVTFPELISQWNGVNYKYVRYISASLIIVFLGVYAAAQLTAGSKALTSLFGWPHAMGALIGSAIVLAYCFSGGIRASIWTDAAQSVVMLGAMAVLGYSTIELSGGIKATYLALTTLSPNYMSWTPNATGLSVGFLIMVISWMVAGIGVVGQPHIMIRFMAVDQADAMPRARLYYFGWYSIFSVLTISVGLLARLLFPDATLFDAELALPALAQLVLPSILIGLMLAGLFSATMSTADSQILSCSAALTQDFSIGKNSYRITKLGTILFTLTALLIALYGSDSVFELVTIAWAALGCAFTPVIIVYVLGRTPTQATVIWMMGMGLSAMIVWRLTGLSAYCYEILPGMLAALCIPAAQLALKRT